MKQFLREWAINILTLTIFISILEIIIPKSNMKKYIETVIGLVIIIVIINPFINVLTSNIDIDKEVFFSITKPIKINNDEISEKKKKNILDIYSLKVKNDIKEIVEKNSEYEVLNIELEIETNDDELGKINRTFIKLNKKNLDSKNSTIKNIDIKVNSINLSNNLVKQDNNNEVNIEKVKDILKDRYKLQSEDILFYLE